VDTRTRFSVGTDDIKRGVFGYTTDDERACSAPEQTNVGSDCPWAVATIPARKKASSTQSKCK